MNDPCPPPADLAAIRLVRTIDPDGSSFYRPLGDGEKPKQGEIVTATLLAFVGQFRQVSLADGTILMVDTTANAAARPPASSRHRLELGATS